MAKKNGAQIRYLSVVVKASKEFDFTLPDADTVFKISKADDIRQMTYSIEYSETQEKNIQAITKAKELIEIMYCMILDNCTAIENWSAEEPSITDKAAIQKVLTQIGWRNVMRVVSAVQNGPEAALDPKSAAILAGKEEDVKN